jgi:lipopolysaccharide/colanic/teichoic acid biosynthesis glycosyltransferase
MTPQKRLLDIVLALLLITLAIPVLLGLMIILAVTEGRPLFYVSERMQTPTKGFALIKLRTMRVGASDGGVTGGNKSNAIPPIYRALRKSRLDELPQLWNVLVGQMSFVGPRPPLRVYVRDFPTLYAGVLRNRPGITGLASLRFHHHEEQLLAACVTPVQTDHVYRTRCVPRKAVLDLIYQRHQSICFDLALIWETARKPFRRH